LKTVIPAGGKGTRLKPYTTVLPKPLLPVGDMPILEIIIRQLESQSLRDIIITVGALGELIVNFFGNGSRLGVDIEYCREDRPLGTVGGLGLVKDKLTDTFLMLNGDTLTTLSFSELVSYHNKTGSIATLALQRRKTYSDFGIVELSETNSVKRYVEKPITEHLVCMGIYVFEPRILQFIKSGEKLDIPDLVETLISSGEDVAAFVFDGYWLDIGKQDDYEKANAEIEKIYPKLFRKQA